MITPAPMELLNFVVLKDRAEEVASRLLAAGSFHPVDIRFVESAITGLTPAQVDKEKNELETLQAKVQDLLRKLRINPSVEYPRQMQCFSLEQTQQLLDGLDQELAPLLQKKEELQEELATHQSILSQVRQYFPLPIQRGAVYSFLEVSTGRIEEKNIALIERSLTNAPHVLYPFRKDNGKVLALFIGLRRDKALLKKVLDDVAWEEIEFAQESEQLSKEAQKQLARKIVDSRAAIAENDARIKKMGETHQETLSRIFSYINLKRSLLEAHRYSCTTEKTALFSGWVPREEKHKVIAQIRQISSDTYIESRSAEELTIPKEEIPVRFQHGSLVKPFELLVDAYGVPRYGTIDPTIFVAISFLIMFGVMFGDLGHGLVLVAAGLVMLRRKLQEKARQAAILMLYCGASSALFGLLYGSVFGIEFTPLWTKPAENVFEFFRLSLMFGIATLTVGIAINIINALRDKDYVKAVFDKSGLIAGVVYWAAIGLVSKFLVAKGAVSPVFILTIAAGLILIFLKPLFERMFHRQHTAMGEGFIESFVEVIEIVLGYLSNTMSFLRIAGFALTHASLFIVIFQLSKTTQSAALGAFSLLVVIIGNLVVFALEGLVVMIQSMRLNYYEFFSKFFVAGKHVYNPLTIREKGSINN